MTVWRRGSESRGGRQLGRGRRRWLLLSVLAVTALTTGGPAVFVATQCWGSGPSRAADRPSAELVALGLNRDEARSYLDRLIALWTGSPMWGPNAIRKWDRRIVLSAEYGLKAIAASIARGVASPDAADDGRLPTLVYAAIDHAGASAFEDERVREFKPLGPHSYIVSLPPRAGFTEAVREFQKKGVHFQSIAGNDDILLTALAPKALAAAASPCGSASRR